MNSPSPKLMTIRSNHLTDKEHIDVGFKDLVNHGLHAIEHKVCEADHEAILHHAQEDVCDVLAFLPKGYLCDLCEGGTDWGLGTCFEQLHNAVLSEKETEDHSDQREQPSSVAAVLRHLKYSN